MIEDMAARKLNPHTQRSHISSCKRFAAWLKRSPDTATPDEVRRFQLHLVEGGASICNRNRIMTGVRFLFRVTLRRHDLAAEIWHIQEPQKLPPVLSPEEVSRLERRPDVRLIVLGNGPRQAIGLGTWILKCKNMNRIYRTLFEAPFTLDGKFRRARDARQGRALSTRRLRRCFASLTLVARSPSSRPRAKGEISTDADTDRTNQVSWSTH